MEQVDWACTRISLKRLMTLLNCSLCNNLLKEPCSFELCNHFFCRTCALTLVNNGAKCPKCDGVLWREHMHVSLKIPEVVEICEKLHSLVASDDEDEEEDDHNGAATENDKANSGDADTIPDAQDIESDAEDMIPVEQVHGSKITSCIEEVLEVKNSESIKTYCDKEIHDTEVMEISFEVNDKFKNRLTEKPSLNSDIICLSPYEANKMEVTVEFEENPVTNGRKVKVVKEQDTQNLHAPLKFVNIHENGDEGETCSSPPRSQFSSVLTDAECQNGAQKNPRKLLKPPKITYSKRLKQQQHDILFENCQNRKKNILPILVGKNMNKNRAMDDELTVFDFSSGRTSQTMEDSENGQSKVTSTTSTITKNKEVHNGHKQHAKNNKRTKLNPPQIRKSKSKIPATSSEKVLPKEDDINDEKRKTEQRRMRNFEKRNMKGETALHTACIKGNYVRAKELIQLGAEPNTKDFAGWTPLHEASNHGRCSIVELLLDHSAIIDMVAGDDNDTPLHDAVSNNRLEVAQLLLERGAPTNIRNRLGLLPVDYALTSNMKNAFKQVGMMQLDTSASIDPQSDSISHGPKVFLTTNLKSAEKGEVQTCCTQLDGHLLEEFDLSVTHVICGVDENRVSMSRTMKYLLGVLTGKWLVSHKWVVDSLMSKKWLREVDYEVKGTVEASDEVPKKARINQFKTLPKLFEGCSFYFSGTFDESLSKDKLINLVKYGGGKILLREPKTSDVDPLITPVSPAFSKLKLLPKNYSPTVIYHAKENSSQICCTEYIIYDPKVNPGHKKVCSPILSSAPVTWLLDCVSSFEILDVRDEHDKKEGFKSSQT